MFAAATGLQTCPVDRFVMLIRLMILIHDDTGTLQRRGAPRDATPRDDRAFLAAGVEILLLDGVVRFIRRSWPRYG